MFEGLPILILVYILVLAIMVGFELIAKVPPMLHTPLMSGTNAVSGIILIGALVVAGQTDSAIGQVLGFVAIVMATINVVGGFMVTNRMLQMFRKDKERE
ncbi:MAG: NAD(P) transhydrogenase subunit alpha [Chloroflexi bacterium]|jgi:NAD(P) transhydrogenase subunit alpha|nr:MAG: NAD(P) transhydrogenase subunit alpha [Chloroflexota bacterium]